MSAAGRLGLSPTLGDERDRVGMPPVPVFVPMPAPVRLNHSSTVKVALRSWVAAAEGRVLAGAVELEGLVGGGLRRPSG